MVRRGPQYDAFATTQEPRWLVSRTMYRSLIEVRRLEPGTDLIRVFLAAMLELLDAGWQIGEFSSTAAHVRYSRGVEQRMLAIEHVDPKHPRLLSDGPGIV